MMRVAVGIDVACAKRKALPVCVISINTGIARPLDLPKDLLETFPRGCGNAEITQPFPFRAAAARVAASLAEAARRMDWTIVNVAIDAPARRPSHGIRKSEVQLAEQGLSVFQTPDEPKWIEIEAVCRDHLAGGGALARLPYANKIWMIYGFELFAAIRRIGLPVIEVYPYAIVRSLLPQSPHKKTPEGYTAQLAALAARTGWRPDALEAALRTCCLGGAKDDRLDAFMAAWVAASNRSALTAYGDPDDPDDSIWCPADARGGTGAASPVR